MTSISNFQLDYNDGEIILVSIINFHDTEDMEDIEAVISHIPSKFDDYDNHLLKVILGIQTAKEAFDELTKDLAKEDCEQKNND